MGAYGVLNKSINDIKTPLFMSVSQSDVASMKVGDMRKELESYGISTKSFLEKKEFVEAIEKAREEGKKPISKEEKKESSSSTTSDEVFTESHTSSSDETDTRSRKEKMDAEMETIKKMKLSEMKKELQEYGISTKSFFEKSEFIKALAEARVDGVKKSSSSNAQQKEEKYDPSYRDVVIQKLNPRDVALLSASGIRVIDTRASSDFR